MTFRYCSAREVLPATLEVGLPSSAALRPVLEVAARQRLFPSRHARLVLQRLSDQALLSPEASAAAEAVVAETAAPLLSFATIACSLTSSFSQLPLPLLLRPGPRLRLALLLRF